MDRTDNAIQLLLNELRRVGDLNNDEFDVAIRPCLRLGNLHYRLEVTETAENHVFVAGVGKTIEEAATVALVNIPSACELWNYDQ